jgi:hypothetical protein
MIRDISGAINESAPTDPRIGGGALSINHRGQKCAGRLVVKIQAHQCHGLNDTQSAIQTPPKQLCIAGWHKKARSRNAAAPGAVARPAAHSGNFSARSIAWKRGSLRSGSKKKLAFVYARYGSRFRIAVSSQSSARAVSPHCA